MNERSRASTTRWLALGWAALLLLAALSVGLLVAGCSPAAPSPNIVFILIDTLRSDALEGNAPFLEALGRQGATFDRVVAPSSWTKTSMASILTGQTPLQHGVRSTEDALPQALVTLAEGLAAAGYQTLGVNSNPWLTKAFRFHEGFDQYKSKRLANAATLNATALKMLQARASLERPAFLYLHYMDVHAPYTPSPEFFNDDPLHVPGRGDLSNAKVEAGYRRWGLDSEEVVERVHALYRAEVRELDAAIADLFQDLEALGFLDDALVIVTSDHGESFLEHATTVHGKNYYPEVYRVPLIMKWTGRISEGQRIGSQVRSVDIAPTIFDFLGLEPPHGFGGRSMLPLNAEAMQDRVALGAVGLNDYIPDQDYVGVVSRDFLYVTERRSGEVEFFDLRTDPGAQKNLGARHPDASNHAAHIEKATRELGDPNRIGSEGSDKVVIDPDTRQQLKALGYLPDDS